VNEFVSAAVDLFDLPSVVVQSHCLRELMAANPKNRGVSQNLVEVGNPVVVESLVEVEPLRLELLATVLCLHLNLLSEIEVVFAVVADLVEQDQFEKAVVVAETQVAERSAE